MTPFKHLMLDQLGKIACVAEATYDERLVNHNGIVTFRSATASTLFHPLPWEAKLVRLIAALPVEARNELCAVMWIGRGDGDAEDFEILTTEANGINVDPIEQAQYIADKTSLAEYLRDGLKELSSPGARARARIREMADVSGDC